MTLAATIALVYVATAAVSGCVCVCHEQSPFERQCHERGGEVLTASTLQRCVVDAGTGAALERDLDDGGRY